MKRAFDSFDQPRAFHDDDDDDDAKAKIIYQTRLNEYLELQKEYVSRKRKLQAAKGKKEKILAQVRFLRQKRKYLLKSQAPNIEKVCLHLPSSSEIESNRGRKQSTSEVAPKKFEQVIVSNSHQKTGEEEEEEGNIHDKDVRFKTKINNPLVRNKGMGKRKMGLPDQVTLKV